MIRIAGAAASAALTAVLLLTLSAERQGTEAAYPGTSGVIAFIDRFTDDVWTMNPDGSNRTQITDSPNVNFQPSFSPDGEHIIYRQNVGQPGLHVVGADGSNDQVIPGTASAFTGTWHPDGDHIAYTLLNVKSDIVSQNLDGSGLANLTNTPDIAEDSPDWSPSGDRIAFIGQTQTGDVDLFVMDADGSDLVNLTNTPGVREDHPDWSPDGTKIIFTITDFQVSFGDIAVIGDDGSNLQMLEDDPDTRALYPVFSPDGTMIAYQAMPPLGPARGPAGVSNTHIFVANADGSNAHSISTAEFPDDFTPEWGVDEPGPLPTPTPSPSPGEELVWGDSNCSGEIDPIDSLLTLRHDAGLSTNIGDCPAFGDEVDIPGASLHLWGDVDCSGEIDPIDSLKLLRFDAGLSVSQEEDCPPLG